MFHQILKKINIQSSQIILKNNSRSYRVGHKRQINHQLEHEKVQFKKDVSAIRKKHLEDYWRVQTQVENEYLQQFKIERIKKQQDDMDKWRTQICNISLMTQRKFEHLAAREKKLLNTMRDKDIEDGKRRLENKYKLDAMQIDSRRWPKIDDLDNSISTNIILPQTILNYQEYQVKLQRLAFYAERGDHEAMQNLLDNKEIMKKKNSFLQPLYRDIKTTIKHMTYTDEYILMREYVRNRQLILNNLPEESQKAKDSLNDLQKQYAKLLANNRQKLRDSPGKRIKSMQSKLEKIFTLLNLWQQYVDIIYAPESEINIMKNLRDNGQLSNNLEEIDKNSLDEINFAQKVKNEEIEQRMAQLFAKDQEEDINQSINEPYMSVKEGLTTDTQVSSDGEDSKTQSEKFETFKESNQEVKEEIEAGIQSSDEEYENKIQTSQKQESLQFNQKSIFEDERQKQIVEYQYNFDDQQTDRFKEKLVDQFAKKQKFQGAVEQTADDDNIDFISKENIQNKSQINMENFNIFGVALSEADKTKLNLNEDSQKEKQKKRKFVSELIQVLTEMDDQNELSGRGSIQDLDSPKTLVDFDIYSQFEGEEKVGPVGTTQQQVTALKYEDRLKLRASLILDAYEQQLKNIDEKSLSYEDKESLRRTNQLLAYLKNVKIIDAPVLLKIYNLHRCQV